MGTRWEFRQEFRGLSMSPIYFPSFPKFLSELGSGIKNGLEGQLEEAGGDRKNHNISFGKAMSIFSGYSV